MSIRSKVLLPMVTMTMVCALIIGLLGIMVVNLFVNDFNDQQLGQAQRLATTILSQDNDNASRASLMVAQSEQMIAYLEEYIASGERQNLVDTSISLLNATGVDFLTIMDTEGNVLVRAHEPDNFGDSLANQANIKSAMRGTQYTTTEKGSAVKLSVRSGTPIYGFDGSMIGIVSLGYRLDQNNFADHIKLMTNTEITVFLGEKSISTTVLNSKGERAIDETVSEDVSTQVLGGSEYTGRVEVNGVELLSLYMPIRDAENVVLGMLFVGLDTSEVDARMVMDTWIMLGVVLFLGIATLLIAMRTSAFIANPIKNMAVVAGMLAAGDIDVKMPEVVKKESEKDEIVLLSSAFSDMISANKERASVIREIADGDLSGKIVPRSQKDIVGIALTELLSKNNDAFSGMTATASQFDTAASQIADDALNLSQGATEQAATIDNLHVVLKRLSGRTVEEAGHAKQAASLSDTVKSFAEKGSHQMDQMMEAVEQISKASESIGKVIKVIDDIAFQTNILALNAAVEAARAGQHGKGFAVVAEEVRNLAAKSAEAAKDTSALIANSMEKARLGAQISADTAASFVDIVGGVNESSIIVEEIADFMQKQKDEIESITRGVDEIGTVISSISAAAEHSASASEELSTQAAIMSNTLSGYKLREGVLLEGDKRLAMPPKS